MSDPITFSYWLLEEGVKLVSTTVKALQSIKLVADESYGLEIKVVTRLGSIPVKGVKIKTKIADKEEDFGTSDAKGQIKDGDEIKQTKVTGATLQITGSYKNDTEKLREEKVSIEITEVEPGDKTQKVKVKHEILKIRDAPQDKDDVDFKIEYDTTGDLAWKDDAGSPVLSVTVKLCTFSLLVPYMNQRATNDTVKTLPGLADGKDPETLAHDVKGPASGGKFAGGVLCFPTSVKMVLDYWGVKKPRSEVLQKYYELWAERSFEHRRDKTTGTVIQSTAPADPAQAQYWLDSTPGDASGYILKRALYNITWKATTDAYKSSQATSTAPAVPTEGQIWHDKNTKTCKKATITLVWQALSAASATVNHEGKEAPATFEAGDIWKDTSGAAPVYKKAVKSFKEWKVFAEADWRVEYTGAKLWEWPAWAIRALTALGPSGGTVTNAPALMYTYTDDSGKKKTIDVAPLTKVQDDDDGHDDLKKVDDDNNVLDKYKEMLKGGWPFIIPTTATDGHIMVARGAVVNEKEEIEWLVVNDPYGNLEGEGSSYQTDEKNVAGNATSDKGKNAYYRNKTLGVGGKLRIKLSERGFSRIEKTLTKDAIAGKLVPGA